MADESNVDWKERAEHWKAVADAEATRCAKEYGEEIRKLRAENLRLHRVFAATHTTGH